MPSGSWPSTSHEARVGDEAVLRFLRQFSVKLKAGLSVEKCLAALSSDSKAKDTRLLCSKMREDMARGASLGQAMSEHGAVFDDCVMRLLELGEQTGKLRASLGSAADYLDRVVRLRRGLRQAVSKPLNMFALILLAIFVAVVALSFLVRETLPAAGAHSAGLSPADKIAISVSHGVRKAWPYFAAFGAACFLALHLLPRLRKLRATFDALSLRIPLLRKASSATALACFADSVAVLMQDGCMLDEAMTIATGIMTNLPMRRKIQLTIRNIEGGQPYLEAWMEGGLLKRRDVPAAQTAERRGQLAEFMRSWAADHEAQAAEHVRALKTFMHTGVAVSLGLTIIAVLLTLYVPVFVVR